MKEKLPTYLLPDRPIAFNRDFVRIGCGIKGALMLSQAVYWSKRTTTKDGSFWKVQEDWEEETGMTRHEQMTALKRLKKLGFMSAKKRGIPAKNYYILNTNKILEELSKDCKWSGKRTTSDMGKRTTSGSESGPHSISEITTEITTEIESKTKKNKIEKEIKEELFVIELKRSLQGETIKKDEIKELKEFVVYWTEPEKNWLNKKYPKLRWELEKTWDMKRRVMRWFKNKKDWGKNTNSNKYQISDEDL